MADGARRSAPSIEDRPRLRQPRHTALGARRRVGSMQGTLRYVVGRRAHVGSRPVDVVGRRAEGRADLGGARIVTPATINEAMPVPILVDMFTAVSFVGCRRCGPSRCRPLCGLLVSPRGPCRYRSGVTFSGGATARSPSGCHDECIALQPNRRREIPGDTSQCNDLDEQSPTATKPPGVNQAASVTERATSVRRP